MFQQCLSSFLQLFHRCFTSVLPVFHQNFTSVSLLFHQCFSSVSPVFNRVSSVFNQCFHGVSSVFLKYYSSVSKVFKKCFISVSKVMEVVCLSLHMEKTTEDKTGLYKIIQYQTKCLFTFKFSKYVKFHFIERLTQLKMYLRHYSKKLSIDQPRSAGLQTIHLNNKQCI